MNLMNLFFFTCVFKAAMTYCRKRAIKVIAQLFKFWLNLLVWEQHTRPMTSMPCRLFLFCFSLYDTCNMRYSMMIQILSMKYRLHKNLKGAYTLKRPSITIVALYIITEIQTNNWNIFCRRFKDESEWKW